MTAWANTRLDRALARRCDEEVADLEPGSQFPDISVFGDIQPDELRSGILHLGNKLMAHVNIYVNLAVRVR